MKLGYELTIEQTQKLVMTPELIQAIKILQFNTQELDFYVEEQLLSNPTLEYDVRADKKSGEDMASREPEDKNEMAERTKETERDPLREYIKERGYDDISYRQHEYDSDKDRVDPLERYATTEVTLPEHLMFQLQFVSNNRACRRIGRYIIESLDENGYMTSTVEEIAKALNTKTEYVDKVKNLIQTFDPAGVCAEDLGRCLLIQLEQKGLKTEAYEKLLTEHLNDLANNRLGVIAKALGISPTQVQDMRDFIKTLEPRPGREFSDNVSPRYIIPDLIAKKVGDEYEVIINDESVPRLRISSYYEKVLRESGGDEQVSKYLTERINAAAWVIKSIEQRKQTIMNVAKSIIKFQREFFDYGEKYLRTLTLKEVADDVGIHESTVSRTVNGKYMECPRGIFELKYFFSAGVEDVSGHGISSNSIKTYIKELIDKEDEKSPLSDQKIVDILTGRGFNISRRTVAKYRDEMGILSSSKRRRY